MSKHMMDKKAVCPFYRHEDPQVIYCDGVQQGTVIHLAFADRAGAKAYKRQCCRAYYGECQIYCMLSDLNVYDEGGNGSGDG